MNNPDQGARASGEEPDRKKRRKRPRGHHYRKHRGYKNARSNDTEEASSSVEGGERKNSRHYGKRSGSYKSSDGTASHSRGGSRHSQSHGRKGDAHQAKLPQYAALDLGTNNCRLLIAVPQQRGRFRVVDGFSRIVRLGEGLGASGQLKQEAMDRAIDALKICAQKLGSRQIAAKRLIATEACRQAGNGQEFLDRVRRETGIKLEIVTRETEAFLAAEGCSALIDRKSSGAVLFDIGGGSSELILVDRTRNRGAGVSKQVVGWTSLPLGVVTIAEKFGGKDVSRDIYNDMVSYVVDKIDDFEHKGALSQMVENGQAHLLGTSGTVTTLAGIHLELPQYDRRRVDGHWMSDNQVDGVVNKLLSMDYEQRKANACIGTERADLVLAGCAILDGIRSIWPSKRLRVADRGLREGLLTQMMDRDGSWIRPKKNRWSKKRRQKRDNRMQRHNEGRDA